MKQQSEKNLFSYLEETIKCLNSISNTISRRNKTKKMRALDSICKVYSNLAQTKFSYAKAGGYNEFNSFVVEEIFTPVLEFLSEEAIK